MRRDYCVFQDIEEFYGTNDTGWRYSYHIKQK